MVHYILNITIFLCAILYRVFINHFIQRIIKKPANKLSSLLGYLILIGKLVN